MQTEHIFHGGAFFDAIGADFQDLRRRHDVINADVLDAWYDPSPKVIDAIHEHLPWLVKTSPPLYSEGLRSTIAKARNIPEDCILTGAGTSSLMYQAIPRLIDSNSKVVVMDPMYGEYAHICEHVVGAQVIRHDLLESDGFQPNLDRLLKDSHDADLVIFVNPNSPTGAVLDPSFFQKLMGGLSEKARIWIDETYIDFDPESESAERWVGIDPRVIVSKSMSKYYALSGLRVGYIAGPAKLIEELEPICPPWSVGLIAQFAAVEALRDRPYYAFVTAETSRLRRVLGGALSAIEGLKVFPSVTNFLLIELFGIDAETVVQHARKEGVYLRNCDSLSARFKGRFIRTAVKDAPGNARIVQVISDAMR
jgi:histidinol-phosphate/aromatic aminotransferase/cobyric acid decarboxylase-like protein